MTETDSSLGASSADDERNRAFGAGLVDDPYPAYHELLSQCPVHEGSIASQFPAMAGFPPLGGVEAPTWSVWGHEQCLDVLRRSEVFSSSWYDATLTRSIGPTVIGMDAPEHRRHRVLLQPAFQRRQMEQWRSDIIGPIVAEHLDRVRPQGRADLYAELASKVPVHTISAALGLPVHDRDQFFDWAIAMTAATHTPEERQAASQAVADYIAPLVAERRQSPRDDLITYLVEAQVPASDAADGVDQRPMTDEEVATFVRLLIIAGAGTTYRAFGSLLFHLLSNPEQFDQVKADPSLVPAAIEESLRIDQPLAHFGRIVRSDTEIDGVTIPAGSIVELNVGSANHDPAQWPDPDRFDIHRSKPDRHLSFGFGVHRCLGIHLARAELTEMLEQCIATLPGLHLDPDDPEVHMTGLVFRLVNRLPCRWEV